MGPRAQILQFDRFYIFGVGFGVLRGGVGEVSGGGLVVQWRFVFQEKPATAGKTCYGREDHLRLPEGFPDIRFSHHPPHYIRFET